MHLPGQRGTAPVFSPKAEISIDAVLKQPKGRCVTVSMATNASYC